MILTKSLVVTPAPFRGGCLQLGFLASLGRPGREPHLALEKHVEQAGAGLAFLLTSTDLFCLGVAAWDGGSFRGLTVVFFLGGSL